MREMTDRIRVHRKLMWRRLRLIPMFCKQCGRDCVDFHAPDDAWEKVRPLIPHNGNVLCYDCFVVLGRKAGLPGYWRLEPQP